MIEDKGSDEDLIQLGDDKPKKQFKSDLDLGFSPDEITKLMKRNLPPPSIILKSYVDKTINLDDFMKDLGEQTKDLGKKKVIYQPQKKRDQKTKNKFYVCQMKLHCYKNTKKE